MDAVTSLYAEMFVAPVPAGFEWGGAWEEANRLAMHIGAMREYMDLLLSF
jgi:hypothetical protein